MVTGADQTLLSLQQYREKKFHTCLQNKPGLEQTEVKYLLKTLMTCQLISPMKIRATVLLSTVNFYRSEDQTRLAIPLWCLIALYLIKKEISFRQVLLHRIIFLFKPLTITEVFS